MNVTFYRSTPVELLSIGDVLLLGVEQSVERPPVPHVLTEMRHTLDGIELYVRPTRRAEGKRVALRVKPGDSVAVELSATQQTELMAALGRWMAELGRWMADDTTGLRARLGVGAYQPESLPDDELVGGSDD